MKNIIRKLLLLICIMMLPFTLTACSGSKNNDNSAKSNNSEDKNADSDGSGSDNASETEAAGKYPSIQEFIDMYKRTFLRKMKTQCIKRRILPILLNSLYSLNKSRRTDKQQFTKIKIIPQTSRLARNQWMRYQLSIFLIIIIGIQAIGSRRVSYFTQSFQCPCTKNNPRTG